MSLLAFLFLVCLTSRCVFGCQNPPLGQLSQYNSVIFGDFNGTSSIIEGSFAASGNVHFTDSSLGSGLPCDSSSPTDNVVVGGSFSMENGGTVFGNLVYGSSASGGSFQCGGQSVQRDSSSFFNSLLNQAVTSSNYLLELNPTGNPEKIGFGLVLDLSDGLEVNVFNSRAFVAQGLGNLRIVGGSPNQTVIINVPGISFVNLLNVFWDFGGVPATNVIFNFPNGTSISGAALKGTILAPKATLNYLNGDFDGQLIVKGFTGRSAGRIRQGLFCGCVPEPTTSTTMGSSGSTGSSATTGTTGQVLGGRTTGTTASTSGTTAGTSGSIGGTTETTGRTTGSTGRTTGSTGRTTGSTGRTTGSTGQVLGGRTTGSTGMAVTSSGSTGLGTFGGGLPCITSLLVEVPDVCECFQSGEKCVCDCDCCPTL